MVRSRIPDIAILSVRGIGVAVMVRISISARIDLSVSFCRTPKRCSSSIMASPRFLNFILFWMSAWVPMTISMVPAASLSMTSACSFFVLNRDMESTTTGQSANLS